MPQHTISTILVSGYSPGQSCATPAHTQEMTPSTILTFQIAQSVSYPRSSSTS